MQKFYCLDKSRRYFVASQAIGWIRADNTLSLQIIIERRTLAGNSSGFLLRCTDWSYINITATLLQHTTPFGVEELRGIVNLKVPSAFTLSMDCFVGTFEIHRCMRGNNAKLHVILLSFFGGVKRLLRWLSAYRSCREVHTGWPVHIQAKAFCRAFSRRLTEYHCERSWCHNVCNSNVLQMQPSDKA